MPTIALMTVGCKVNQYETEVLTELFRKEGYEIVPADAPADVYLLNSCTVTATGDQKTRQLLRRMKRQNPSAVAVLTGCYPQAFPKRRRKSPRQTSSPASWPAGRSPSWSNGRSGPASGLSKSRSTSGGRRLSRWRFPPSAPGQGPM